MIAPLSKVLPIFLAGLFILALPAHAQNTITAGEAEMQKCQDRIASVQRDVLSKYETALMELQTSLQKTADLEGALAVRAERTRILADQSLEEKNYVAEPKPLRLLQTQTVGRMQDLLGQLVSETIPKLVELKRQFTIAGKLDDAVAVRTSIETLQNTYLPAVRVESGASVGADTLVTAYSADRTRADKIYRGQKIVVHGVLGGFRVDPADAKNYQLFVTGGASAGWVQCTFNGSDHKFREEKGAYNVPVLAITSKDGEVVRVQKGSAVDVRGLCEGWEESVRLARCEFLK